jgi:hypothetical protein
MFSTVAQTWPFAGWGPPNAIHRGYRIRGAGGAMRRGHLGAERDRIAAGLGKETMSYMRLRGYRLLLIPGFGDATLNQDQIHKTSPRFARPAERCGIAAERLWLVGSPAEGGWATRFLRIIASHAQPTGTVGGPEGGEGLGVTMEITELAVNDSTLTLICNRHINTRSTTWPGG